MDLDQQEFQQEKMKNNSVERYSNHLMLKEIGGYGQKLLKESKLMSGESLSWTEKGLPDKITPTYSGVISGILLNGKISQ